MGNNTLRLSKDSMGVAIQAFPLVEGRVNLTTGTHTNIYAVHCVVGGTITITWPSGATDDILCAGGDDFSLLNATSVLIVNGTFHLG